jgi:PPK2 family polyphosphate:nucleotide phosphotransferase
VKRYVVKEGARVRLARLDPADTGSYRDDAQTQDRIREDLADLSRLQNLLYAARTHAVLVVLQGIDTAGKDGTIRHVFSGINPQGCRVASFKKPTEVELAHDFLWRVHAVCPAAGEIAVFNRSHYEGVLVERVHGLVPKSVWSRRYGEIRRFEELLVRSGTIIVKLFLNLSKKEQKERLLAREADPEKRWKVNPADWEERKLWDDYQSAYQEMLEKTSTEEASWVVVPSDEKWYRNLVVSGELRRRLAPYRAEWRAGMERRGKAAMTPRSDNIPAP